MQFATTVIFTRSVFCYLVIYNRSLRGTKQSHFQKQSIIFNQSQAVKIISFSINLSPSLGFTTQDSEQANQIITNTKATTC